jgi:hypothetical protein
MSNVVQQQQLAKANGEQEVKTIVKDIEKRRVKTRSDQRAKKSHQCTTRSIQRHIKFPNQTR